MSKQPSLDTNARRRLSGSQLTPLILSFSEIQKTHSKSGNTPAPGGFQNPNNLVLADICAHALILTYVSVQKRFK